MFGKILIANRGEIACRIIKSARALGIKTVAVYSEADRRAPHVRLADEAYEIGPAPAAQSYIHKERLLEAVRKSGAEAVHPGYGFLSENAGFAAALAEMGVAFIGPPAAAIEAMGDKITSKKIAAEAGVSTVPGHMGLIEDEAEALRIARMIGYPVMLKASAGGGGKGMRIAWSDQEVREGFAASRREAAASFGDDRMFIEKFVENPRHIEIQILADGHGNCVYLHERECSIQRRNQKVIEEAPSPFLDPETRAAMGAQACALAKAVGYQSAGTVEFIVDGARNFYFLEMNTRLQVEHPVTELITGLDLVELMIRVAAGEKLPFAQKDIALNGWAMEARLYAEDPYRNFLPSTGRLTRYRPPPEGARESGALVRNDTGVEEGGEISMFYDPMIAKLCTWAPTRAAAIAEMREALDAFEIEGIGHNLPFLSTVMMHPRFEAGALTTGFIAEEFPGGFAGRMLTREESRPLAAAAAAMHRLAEVRRSRVSGTMDNHRRRVGDHFIVDIGTERFDVTLLSADRAGASLRFADADKTLRVESDWRPGGRLAALTIDGMPLAIKVQKAPLGFRFLWRGADLKARVMTPRQAALLALMPERAPPDLSRYLLCPMPGLVTALHVTEGALVEDGQALATVEAMKMENLLRAPRAGRIKRIAVKEGASLRTDDLIMEFDMAEGEAP